MPMDVARRSCARSVTGEEEEEAFVLSLGFI